jgi:hypothetical protein
MQQLSIPVVRFPDPPLSPTQLASTIGSLVDALGSEYRLIEELIVIMRRQREAVGRDDLQGVDDSVYAIQRVLFTLGEARKRRRTLNKKLGTAEDLALRDLEAVLGPMLSPELVRAREALQHAARTLSQEVAVNRRVLREALAAGDDYVRMLYGAPERATAYPEPAAAAAPAASGYLINRRA